MSNLTLRPAGSFKSWSLGSRIWSGNPPPGEQFCQTSPNSAVRQVCWEINVRIPNMWFAGCTLVARNKLLTYPDNTASRSDNPQCLYEDTYIHCLGFLLMKCITSTKVNFIKRSIMQAKKLMQNQKLLMFLNGSFHMSLSLLFLVKQSNNAITPFYKVKQISTAIIHI